MADGTASLLSVWPRDAASKSAVISPTWWRLSTTGIVGVSIGIFFSSTKYLSPGRLFAWVASKTAAKAVSDVDVSTLLWLVARVLDLFPIDSLVIEGGLDLVRRKPTLHSSSSKAEKDLLEIALRQGWFNTFHTRTTSFMRTSQLWAPLFWCTERFTLCWGTGSRPHLGASLFSCIFYHDVPNILGPAYYDIKRCITAMALTQDCFPSHGSNAALRARAEQRSGA